MDHERLIVEDQRIGLPVTCAQRFVSLEAALEARRAREGRELASRPVRRGDPERGEEAEGPADALRDRRAPHVLALRRCLERGLIVGKTGPTFPPPRGSVIKFKPAITVTPDLVDEMCAIFDEVLGEAERNFGYVTHA